MTTLAASTFEVTTWDEKPYSEIEGGPKLTHTHTVKIFHGELEGESTLDYLMIYNASGTTNFYGLERVVGKIAGREGSFVLEHTGTDADNETKDASTIVPGSGTGELSNLRGTGNFTATREAYPFLFTLDYEFVQT